MHGIVLKSGVNNCLWNWESRCTNKEITRSNTTMSRDWDSKQNCTYTILGIHLCHCYEAQKQ
jgi:hypothetical protein